MVTVTVKNGNVDSLAMKDTQKETTKKEGLLKELKKDNFFEKPSAKKSVKIEGIKRYQRNLKKKQERLGY